MMRIEAVQQMLLEDVAGLGRRDLEQGADPDTETDGPELPAALTKARRRAWAMVALDWAAILILFLLRERGVEFLPLGASPETVFTIGILVVAVHSGYRLGNLDKYGAVARLWSELAERRE